jgi:hypothetical protein
MDSKNIQIRLEPPSGTTLAIVCFLLNYMPGCQGFCGWFRGKALQGMEIQFIHERV